MKPFIFDYNRAYKPLAEFILTSTILALVLTMRFLKSAQLLLPWADKGKAKAA